jgi:hypothetical protein
MNNSPRLFPKLTIVIFSTFGSTFFGSLLYAANLKEINKSKFIAPAIIFSIIYTYALNKLSLRLEIPSHYSFFPIHLIGGLFLAGPSWKFQIGEANEFLTRKIWGPSIVLIILLSIYFLSFFYYKSKQGMRTPEFTLTTQSEYNKAFENAKFITQDSLITFFDLNISVIGSSYFFTTKVEDVHTFYNQIYYEEGRFSAMCTRVPLTTKDVFDLSMFKNEYTFTPADSINSGFKSLICTNYVRKLGDTVFTKGTIALIKIDDIGYQYVTQYSDLNDTVANSISAYLINNIFPDSLAQAQRKLGSH